MTVPRFFLFASLAAASLVAACGSDAGDATGAVCPQTQTLTYANFGQAFVTKWCGRCHTGDQSPNLSTQANIQANRTEIDKVAASGPDATNTKMPEGSSPTTAERAQLGEWLACGAP